MRKLASIAEIASCDPIPDTERLSVATMAGKGWRVVTGRDEFRPGDLAVYFEIDSYLPPDDARYAFLHERCLKRFVSKGGGVLCASLEITHVQVLEPDFPFFDRLTTMDEALAFAEGRTLRGNEREGIVMKASDGIDDTHFKVVSNRYLLKQQD